MVCGLHANSLIYSINLISPQHTGLRELCRDQWICNFCRDGVIRCTRHLPQHLISKRHIVTVKYLNQPPLPTDQDESKHMSMYVAQSSNEVILNVDAPPTVNDSPAEVSYGLHLCDCRLMAFTG